MRYGARMDDIARHAEQVATEDESAMSTHDPETLKLEEKVETE